MAHPLRLLSSLPPVKEGESLGEQLMDRIIRPGWLTTLLDSFPNSHRSAILSPDCRHEALPHAQLRDFLAAFALPSSAVDSRLGPNDRVVIALPGGPSTALAILSVMCYHTAIPISLSCSPSQLQQIVLSTRAKAILTTLEVGEQLQLQALCARIPVEVIYLRDRSSGSFGPFDLALPGDTGVISQGHVYRTSKLQAMDDECLLLYSMEISGATKVVAYSVQSLLISTCALIKSWGLEDTDMSMSMLPLCNAAGIICGLLAPILSAGSVVVHASFDAKVFWQSSIALNATWYCGSPVMHQAILLAKPKELLPLRDTRYRLICSIDTGLLPIVAQNLSHAFGVSVLPSYGIAECMPITIPPLYYHLEKPGSYGVVSGPGLSIRDPASLDHELPPGTAGAVCVCGSPLTVGHGNSVVATVDASQPVFTFNGWYDTGDCGYVDNEGHLFLVGHSNEIIHQGSHFISPFDVEDAILSAMCGSVMSVAVFPVRHDTLGETVGAAIVCSPAKPRPGLADLHARLTDTLSRHKWPFLVVYMDEMPQTPEGQILRADLPTRFNLPVQSDMMPWLHRHYEVRPPTSSPSDPPTSLSESCAQVSIDLASAGQALFDLPEVIEAAVRQLADDSLQAAVYTSSTSLSASSIKTSLRRVLPGYNIPETIFVLWSPLPKTADNIDFNHIQRILAEQSAKLSPTALLVRGVVAGILHKDISLITGDSDFFLLGGNPSSLGQLAHAIHQDTGCNVSLIDLCINSTVNGMAAIVDTKRNENDVISRLTERAGSDEGRFSGSHLYKKTGTRDLSRIQSDQTLPVLTELNNDYDDEQTGRSQLHPIVLVVQSIPLLFFYPLRAAWIWAFALVFLAFLTEHLNTSSWTGAVAVAVSAVAAWASSCVLFPAAAILFKWIVIGRHKPGEYRMYSNYYLRWWIVNTLLRTSGQGIFGLHPRLIRLRCRLLGARVGHNVQISRLAQLAEHDLLTIPEGCRIDDALVRGFCVERDGFFSLAPVILGRGMFVNRDTQIAPGTIIPQDSVWGPHASSQEQNSPSSFRDYNRWTLRTPDAGFRLSLAYPTLACIYLVCYVPWLITLYYLATSTALREPDLNSVASIVFWFSRPKTIGWFAASQAVRVIVVPVLRLVTGLVIKHLLGIDRTAPLSTAHVSQWTLTRRYIYRTLLSKEVLDGAFDVVGRHHALVTFVYRALGARIGKRVRWPASGIYCLEPELLNIQDDVVLGSGVDFYTSDSIGSSTITIGSGANIGDQVTLLPGTHIGKNAVIGSGLASARDSVYEENSTWGLNSNGQAALTGVVDSTRLAPHAAAPPPLLNSLWHSPLTNAIVSISAACAFTLFWSIPASTTAQLLRLFYIHLPGLDLFAPTWYRLGTMYGLVACAFILIYALQNLLALVWGVIIKWLVLGRHKQPLEMHDSRLYDQRQARCSTLSRVLRRGNAHGGVLEHITGTVYLTWFYRALGMNTGRDCCLWAGGRIGRISEPSLVSLGSASCLDDCLLTGHTQAGSNIILQRIDIAQKCAVRSGSEVAAGTTMQPSSMLLEHSLLAQGTTAEADTICWGWPARQLKKKKKRIAKTFEGIFEFKTDYELEKAILAI